MKVLWIDIKPSDEADYVDPAEEAKINATIKATEDFFRENSGGLQTFAIDRATFVMNHLSRANCNNFSMSASPISEGIKAYRALDPTGIYHRRVLSYYKSCRIMRFG